ncbi:MAG: hypothetical protein RI571_06620 [Roseovarius sp.]|nr:hypothetical protein [Roseovarius sp.]
MATQFSMLGIMNAALTERGWDEIVSLNDGTPEFRLMQRQWPRIVEAELEDGNYQFSRQETTLTALTPGRYGFDNSFQLPASALHVRHVWFVTNSVRTTCDHWSMDDDGLYATLPTGADCVIEYINCPDPAAWSARFAAGVQYKLEAALLRGLEGDAREASEMDGAGEIEFQKARTKSSQSKSSDPITRQGGLAGARFRNRA